MKKSANKKWSNRWLVLMMVASIGLTGCGDIQDLENLSFVLAIGMDYGQNGLTNYTFQFASDKGARASTEDGSPEDKQANLISVDAPGLFSAVQLVDSQSSKRVSLSLTRLIIISQRVAEDGLTDIFNNILGNMEIRPDASIAISRCEPAEFLQAVKPTEYSTIKFYDRMLGKSSSHLSTGINMSEMINIGSNPTHSTKIPLVGINDGQGPDNKSMDYRDDTTINQLPGQSLLVSENKAEILGFAVLKDGKIIENMGSLDSTIQQIMDGRLYRSYFTMKHPDPEIDMVSIRIYSVGKSKITADVTPSHINFKIKIKVEGEFTGIQQNTDKAIDEQKFIKAFEERMTEITKELLERSAKMEADFLGLSRIAKGRFLTQQQWEAYGYQNKFKHSNFDVSYKLTIRHYK